MPPRKKVKKDSKSSQKDQPSSEKNPKKSNSSNTSLVKKPVPLVDGGVPTYCHWLMKSEPESRYENGIDVKFGIEDLQDEPDQTACWDGVRNYQARNFMRDQMKKGHQAFFYHSNCKEPGIAGIMQIVRESYPDHTQFDRKDPHYDGSSKKDNPKWFMVDIKFTRMLKRFIPLSELKALHLEHKSSGGPLMNMALFTRARLSVQPVCKGGVFASNAVETHSKRGPSFGQTQGFGNVQKANLDTISSFGTFPKSVAMKKMTTMAGYWSTDDVCAWFKPENKEEWDFILTLEDKEP